MPPPIFDPVLLIQIDARGNLRIAGMRLRVSAAVSQIFPSFGRYDMTAAIFRGIAAIFRAFAAIFRGF